MVKSKSEKDRVISRWSWIVLWIIILSVFGFSNNWSIKGILAAFFVYTGILLIWPFVKKKVIK